MTQQLNKYPIWDMSIRANPQPLYDEMRQNDPVFCGIGPLTKRKFWFFTRYDDCVSVLKDQRFGKEFDKHLSPEQVNEQPVDNAFSVINRHMLNLDPPDHTRLRSLVHKAFTPRMVQNLQPRIQDVADELLLAMQDKTETNLLEDFAFPLPITVIAEMLGIPASDRAQFRSWTQALLFGAGDQNTQTALMNFLTYMNEKIDAVTVNPQEDVLSGLVQAEEGGDKLDREELLSMIFLLLVAGHETTVNLIGNGTLALIQHPEEKQKLINDPTLIKTAIEEILRWNGPVEIPTMRWAFEDVEVGGTVIPKGNLVMPILLAANRDPAVFESPNRFDITRTLNKHIAFGAGIHYCLGAPLARMEGTIAINALLKAFPNIDLAVETEQLQWNENLLLHGMKALPVTL